MLSKKTTYAFAVVLFASGCADQSVEPQFRAYDLTLTHTAPYSTYIQVSPGSRDANLPRFREMDSVAFSKYLRESIGCVYDEARGIHPLGSKRTPAGYMVPIRCIHSN